MLLKLSSVKIISEASLATSVPAIPCGKNLNLKLELGKKIWFPHHGEADVSLLKGWTVIGTVSGDSHYFSIGTNFAIDDAFDQRVLVDWLRSGQNSQLGPDLIQLLLRHLNFRMNQ